MQIGGPGVQGDATLEGFEESFVTYTDDLIINQLRHASKSTGRMSEQRVPFNVREQCRSALTDWWADRFDRAFLLQAAGCNFTSGPLIDVGFNSSQAFDPADTRYTLNNAIIAPSSGYQFWTNSKTNDEGLASAADIMALNYADTLVVAAKLSSPQVRPARIKVGNTEEDVYVWVLHPRQIRDIRQNTNSGQWLDIQKAAMTGGDVEENPIFTGAVGMYNNVILKESARVPPGVHHTSGAVQTNCRRSVFLGAQSLSIGYGAGSEFGRWDWVEKKFDYDNKLGVAAGCIVGMKKNQYNSTDYGCMVLSSYAV
jgi:N4-gp56 family major capsid protein